MKTKGLLAAALVAAGVWGAAAPARAEITYTDYGTARGWLVQSVATDGDFMRCEAMKADVVFMLSYSVEGWTVTVDAVNGNPTEAQGMIDIDRASFPATFYQMDDGRYGAFLDEGAAGALRAGSYVVLDVGGQITEGPLVGSAAAMGKLEECQARAGAGGGSSAAAAPAPVAPAESDATRLGAGCPAFGMFASVPSDQPAHAIFVNQSDVAVSIYWIDFDGQIVEYGATLPGETWEVDTWSGHFWLAKDFDGTCHGGMHVATAGQNVFAFK